MTLHEAWQLVKEYNNYSNIETCEWFDEIKYELKMKTPNDLIKKGQQKKVIEFIKQKYGSKK